MQKTMRKFVPMLLMVGLISFGCAGNQGADQAIKAGGPTETQKKSAQLYKGKIVGKSNKAKTISIEVGKGKQAKVMMVKFDEQTKGMEHVAKGHAAIITYEQRKGETVATSIKPKLAKLPQGVTEIKTRELQALVDEQQELYLVDSRPARRYGQAHLPGAVSIPVPLLKKKKAALLPADRDRLLIFYCGGPT
ncbi:rhodanese-like domain-containing protein [Desulfogranum mediterraneum]|uniref:rhodanese-like domain-containing protein n=1 Tax=Desulfogranum mediterraneum TaxID=160661 RepID=UPI0012947A47|nr:rhodanese-like domain-containing protein [Desulfogranum mediterraneum]